jgi:hypothetical protein
LPFGYNTEAILEQIRQYRISTLQKNAIGLSGANNAIDSRFLAPIRVLLGAVARGKDDLV